MKKLYLVDVSSLFFRAFYAVKPLTTPQGLPVNAIFGFLSMVVKLLKDEKPDYLVFCYDRKEPSFRKEVYSEYKANRTEMPPELAVQIPYIKRLVDYLGIVSLERESYEADDLIGSLASYGTRQNCEVIIVSGDKDFAQIVQPGVILYDTMKDTRIDEQGVFAKWGVTPSQMVDYLSIVGDTSDNVPGVDGIGPKGAQKLLADFGSLDGIYENIENISSKSIKEKLIKSREQAYLAKRLVQIVTDLEFNNRVEDFKIQGVKETELRALLQELNFKTFERTLLGQPNSAPNAEVTVIPSASSPVQILANSLQEKLCSVSEFLACLQPAQELWGLKLKDGPFYFSDGQTVFTVGGSPEEIQLIGPATDAKMIQWKGFDLKSIWTALDCGTPMGAFDGMLAAYVLKSGDTGLLGKVLSEALGDEFTETASPALLFAGLFELERRLVGQLRESELYRIYLDLEMPLSPVLLRMEKRGLKIDVPFLKEFEKDLGSELLKVQAIILEMAQEEFNIASPKQLAVVLFDKLKLPPGKKTKTGYSTDNEVLEKLEHPIAKHILEFRELTKLKSTYVDSLVLLAEASPQHRIHTQFKQAMTSTGRLSSINPNLQNIPIRTERGQKIRKAFIAEKGNHLLSADYSQIELRILAHISEDPGLIKAFRNDLDIHSATAAEIFNVELQAVTPEQRRAAKAVNFGIAYGQGAFGLAANLGIGRIEAQGIIQRYFERFKGVQEYIETTTKQAHKDGFVTTLFGRRRNIVELQSKIPMVKKFGERAAINAPIQGTASDLVKKAMIEIEKEIPVPMLLQVHDELIFEDTPASLEKHTKSIVTIMERVMTLKVPLKVNTSTGPNWDEAH